MKAKEPSLLHLCSAVLVAGIGKGFAVCALSIQIARERRTLDRLNDAQLKDIGISREDAMREGQRSLLSIPANRLKRKRQAKREWTNNDAARQSVAKSR